MQMSQQINELVKAVSNFQGLIRPAVKDGTNPYFKSSYSSLTSVWESIREPLALNQLAVFQDARTVGDHVSVTTVVAHSSGQWMSFGPLEIAVKKEAHAVGSATSYAKRYALSAALGIVSEEDDDGNAANTSGQSVKPPEKIGTDLAGELLQIIPDDKMQETVDNICRAFNIKDVQDIPKNQFNRVREGLKKKFPAKVVEVKDEE